MAGGESSAIQKRETVTALDTTEHAKRMEAMRELIKKTVCPSGINDAEFALFMEQAKRSGLDPLLKQAFCVPRRQKVSRNGRDEWVDKHEFQPAEAGMIARAERFPDFRGVVASAVYAEDEIMIDQGKGEVLHRFNPAKRKGSLVGAWSRLVRDGKEPIVIWVDFAGYVQQSPLWAKMPATMIEKVARVGALRKAYPEAFGGLYVAGERPDDVDTGEDEPAAPTLSKPAMPATTATREAAQTLEKEPERVPVVMFGGAAAPKADVVDAETVPATPPREPGSDDGDEGPELWETWVAELETVTTRDAFKTYADRAKPLPAGSDGRKAMSKALKSADERLKKDGK